MSIEIYPQDKYSIPVIDGNGEHKYVCSALNAAKAIVNEHNLHNPKDPWKVGKTVRMVSVKNVAWQAVAVIDWDKLKAGKSKPDKCVKVTAVEVYVTLQESKPRVTSSYMMTPGGEPGRDNRWIAVALSKDVATAMAKQAAVDSLTKWQTVQRAEK